MNNVHFPKDTFGLGPVNVILETEAFISSRIPVRGLSDRQAPDTPDFYSALGTPVYGSLKLGSTDPNKDPQNQYIGIDGNTYTFDTVTLPIAIITVTMRHNIVETKVQGRNGRIKEYIGLDDYDITINGVFDNPQGKAPKTDVALLKQMAIAQIPVPVTSYFLNQFDIHYIVIREVFAPQEPGKYSSQAFTISAISDIPLDSLYP